MVRARYDQKPYRRTMMETVGRHGAPQPVQRDRVRPQDPRRGPGQPGSLGIAISEAVEAAGARDDTRYALGSVLNHVLMHQTVIGEEALLSWQDRRAARPARRLHRRRLQLRRAGVSVPAREARGQMNPTIRCVEPAACPSLTKGDLPLRLRRHRRVHPAAQDAHARARLRPRPDPRRRAALPRHGPAALAHLRARPDRGGGQPAARVLRGRPAVRPDRGHRPRAGADPRAGHAPSARRRVARSPGRRR